MYGEGGTTSNRRKKTFLSEMPQEVDEHLASQQELWEPEDNQVALHCAKQMAANRIPQRSREQTFSSRLNLLGAQEIDRWVDNSLLPRWRSWVWSLEAHKKPGVVTHTSRAWGRCAEPPGLLVTQSNRQGDLSQEVTLSPRYILCQNPISCSFWRTYFSLV